MTATALLSCSHLVSRGTSETAKFIAEQAQLGRRQLEDSFAFGLRAKRVFDELCTVYEQCQEPNWDGYGAEPISEATYRHAFKFLEALPLGTPPPSVGSEGDGHLTLEWYRNPNRVLSVSISPDAMIYFAALLGSSKRSGTEPFFGEVPDEVLQIIYRLFPA